MCPEIPICLLSSCKGRKETKVKLFTNKNNTITFTRIYHSDSKLHEGNAKYTSYKVYNIKVVLVLLTTPNGLYLFIIVKGHELDGSVGKYSDHHCPVTLVQAKIAFFLWHSLESGEHSCKKKSRCFPE